MASRLTRRHTPVREWEKLCLADRERRTLRPFADLFAPEMDDDNIIDAEFVEVPDPSDVDHQVRAAYLLVAVMAGTLCMVLGGLLLI